MREEIGQVFNTRSEEFKESRLKEQIEKIKRDPLINNSDFWMADIMKKKYGQEFLNCVSGELPHARRVSEKRARPSEPEKPQITPTCFGSQPAMPSSGSVTKSPATCSGGRPATPSKEGATQGPSSCSGGQHSEPAMEEVTPGPSKYVCGHTTEWQNDPQRVDSDLEDSFDFEVGPVTEEMIAVDEGSCTWLDPS